MYTNVASEVLVCTYLPMFFLKMVSCPRFVCRDETILVMAIRGNGEAIGSTQERSCGVLGHRFNIVRG